MLETWSCSSTSLTSHKAEMWHRMWQDTQQGVSSRTGTPLPGCQRPPLADPPVVKELVRAEVRMLLQTLRERAGRNGEELLSLYKPDSVNYALGHVDRSYRNQEDSRPASRFSVLSVAEEEIEAVRDKLNINGIEEVVYRLQSLFTEECEALKRDIKQLQKNIFSKSQQDFNQTEPTLEELKDLRNAIQKDLERYPVSDTSSVKDVKSTHRLASGQVASRKPCVLSASSVLRPNPLSSPSYTHPRPPTGPPPNRTPTSLKPLGQSSSSKTHCPHRSTSAIDDQRQTTSAHCKRPHTTPPSRPCSLQIKRRDSNPSPEQDSLHSTTLTNTPSFPIKSQRNSPAHKTHLSPQGSIHNKGTECNLSPPMERKHSPAPRSRNTSIVPSAISALSYESNKSKSADFSLSTTERSKTPNGPHDSTCGSNLLSAPVPLHNSTRKSAEIPTAISETGSSTEQVGNKQRSCGMNTNKTGQLKDVTLVHTQPKGHFYSSPKRPLKVSASQQHSAQQEQTETEFLNRFLQPVPPARLK